MTLRVLLADDEPMVRRAIATVLTRAGYEVVSVEDGREAIALAGEPFDIVIADLNMIDVGGIAVVQCFKARFGVDVCCVVLSGEDSAEVGAACYAAGADDVIVKPVSPAELRLRMTQATSTLRDRAA